MKYSNLSLGSVMKLAWTLGATVRKTPVIIGLSGNLGAGKTTFAKSFAKALGVHSLKSPTFIISQRYPLKNKFLYHLDFYRLNSQKQLEVLSLDEILSGNNIVLIEWIEKFPKLAKKCDILINLKVKLDNKRDVTIKHN